MSSLKYQSTAELTRSRRYWAQRENTAKLRKQAIDEVLALRERETEE